jgi:hypothetical protein
LTLDSLLNDAHDVTIPEERKQELSKKRKHKIFNILDISYYVIRILYYVICISYYILDISYYFFAISYYVLDTYLLVLVFNRMSKKLKVVSKKLFGRKSKAGSEVTLFRGSTSGSSRRDKILKHIDLTLVGQMICFQRSKVILTFSYNFTI